ncbi:helix-turn-helix domain-containing protein [Streptomyces hygroscopicus]|uniref:helix-turn-helix domain-containing protein n=1 Tax=Streptomyces hygroscopicus TaxID=1912 RepID=UPI001FCC46FB|nr:helix-turn-helix transcriptional regulator [Streptomyces hygroscopicus]BDH10235.1 transcriptional regulator [Streptomyces hygroscopicus]
MANASRQAAWEYWGAELKRRREESGLTQEALGRQVFVSGGYIGQFEQAIRKPQLDVALRIDEVLQTDGFFERTWRKLIDDQRYPDYFAAAAELERLATKINDFESMIVPGLLQTAAYTRAFMLAGNPLATEEYIEEKVRGRLDRAVILKDTTRPVYWAVLHEAVLRVPVGSPAVMVEQLEHIAQLARERKILLQVLPFAAGAYPVMGKSLRLMEFGDAPPTAYTEGAYSGNLLDDPAVVKWAQAAYDLVRAVALSPEASLALLESAAEDYRRCASTT